MIEILDCPFSKEIKNDLIKWVKLEKQKHSSGLVLKSKEHTEPETPEIKDGCRKERKSLGDKFRRQYWNKNLK